LAAIKFKMKTKPLLASWANHNYSCCKSIKYEIN